MPNNSRKNKEEETKLHLEIARQMVSLSTAGFGLVAALAWNNLIMEITNNYIKKFLPASGQLVSLFIYAVVVTILAVFVTLQLSKIVKRLEK
ncbi:MAG: hypothetical protein HYV38_02660 [Candidatus Levybacteria bacterium]|nr:hypothetical protein [Candidatus Levybacteria bacterium]MBI2420959.1 hypothetical protein [Candidatus Levybacteria bacterium]